LERKRNRQRRIIIMIIITIITTIITIIITVFVGDGGAVWLSQRAVTRRERGFEARTRGHDHNTLATLS
jgi:ABC-type phosphate transport system permease subunit